jgi:hypothetical protein
MQTVYKYRRAGGLFVCWVRCKEWNQSFPCVRQALYHLSVLQRLSPYFSAYSLSTILCKVKQYGSILFMNALGEGRARHMLGTYLSINYTPSLNFILLKVSIVFHGVQVTLCSFTPFLIA